ncbi:MAG: nucleotidyltransferase [Gemmataceae bacterium]
MTQQEAIRAVIDALDTLAIPYMVVGSYSSTFYGIPRLTQDADMVVEFGSVSASRLASQLGPSFRLDPQMSFETTTLTQRHVLEVVGIPFTIELFHLSDDPHDRERFRRRLRVTMMGRELSIPTVEDVVITKLRWALHAGRSKDKEDVRDVIAVQGEKIDWSYVHNWCAQHGTRALLDEIRESIPPHS